MKTNKTKYWFDCVSEGYDKDNEPIYTYNHSTFYGYGANEYEALYQYSECMRKLRDENGRLFYKHVYVLYDRTLKAYYIIKLPIDGRSIEVLSNIK